MLSKLFQKLFRALNCRLVRKATLDKLVKNVDFDALNIQLTERCRDIDLLKAVDQSVVSECLTYLDASRSQLRQDLFVLSELNFKKNGFFVEFGATNGVTLSNTWLLENQFAWKGIVAEPAKKWHAELARNRNCHISTDCVWRSTGDKLTFNETEIGEISTIDSFSDCDPHRDARRSGERYLVETISLQDLLDHFQAPDVIDYLSIDTEGSEFSILNSFDFKKYKIRIITCEHNRTESRKQIYDLLSKHGYERKFVELSEWDDWYILADD